MVFLNHYRADELRDDDGNRGAAQAKSDRTIPLRLPCRAVHPNGRGEEVAKAAMPMLRDGFGLDRLVWGSDWPHTLFEMTVKYSEQRRFLDEWLPDARERQIVLAETPATLFAFTA